MKTKKITNPANPSAALHAIPDCPVYIPEQNLKIFGAMQAAGQNQKYGNEFGNQYNKK